MTDEIEIAFPDARFDEMRDHARSFDRASRPSSDARWRFDMTSQFDGAETVFTARQLEYIRQGVNEIKYPALKAMGLIPWNTSLPSAIEFYTVNVMDQVGEVKVTRDMSGDAPRVELKTTSVSMPIFPLRLAYAYNIDEARAAMLAGMPLLPKKAAKTREQMERKLDDIAFLGDSTMNCKGLLNSTGTDTYTVPTTGAGASTKWDDKSPTAILVDLFGPADQVVKNTNEVEIPTDMLLPVSSRNLISRVRVGDGTSSTVLQYFLENSKFVKSVDATFKLESNSGWTGKRMVVYKKDPDNLEMIVPQPFEQFQPEARGLEVVTQCRIRTGGIALYLPKSVIYGDNI